MGNSMKEVLLNHLMAGNSISALEALVLFNTMKATARISDLRLDGYRISDEWEENLETGKRFKIYFCTEEDKAHNRSRLSHGKV